MATKVILIRHGETDYSCQRRYCGSTDIGLNETGRLQAKKLAKRLASEKIQRVYSSNMKRALEFAKLVFKDTFVKKVAAFNEIHFGEFEGLRYEDILDKFPKQYSSWLKNPLDMKVPGGESLEHFAQRVRKALAEVLSLNKEDAIAIVVHAGPIAVILCDCMQIPLQEIWQVMLNLGGISIVDFDKGGGVVNLLNDTSHLDE